MNLTLDEFGDLLATLLPRDNRPVVAYTGIWTFARIFPMPLKDVPEAILGKILEIVGPDRTLLMPCYTSGFNDGVIDLDNEPGNTGIVNELLRKTPRARRTASAFFSFAALGPQADEVANLRPRDAWGDGSLFEWIEHKDAHVLVLGVPWRMCSFLHRVEWLAQCPYRYLKEFAGEMIRDGKREPLMERLFVRNLDPLASNTWPHLDTILLEGGMRSFPLGQGRVAEIGARSLVTVLMPRITSDPFAFVKNPEFLRSRLVKTATGKN
ncbi:MAG: AAC(3) family N-acetyltransferase [Nitrospinales bacterium]